MKNLILRTAYFIFSVTLLCSCKNGHEEEDKQIITITSVKVANPLIETITEYIELNATSTFLKKDFIKSNTNGYVEDVNISIGEYVKKGQVLFTLQTKESRALANYKNNIDTSLHFSGIISIHSPKEGVISAISHQKGDYVQDGEQLAILSEESSLVFLVDAPYEFHNFLKPGNNCIIILPDGTTLQALVASALPSMDISSQTQNFIIKPVITTKLPEGLIAKVQLVKRKKENAIILPKSAILTDEKQEDFWVMKLINDSTAVKISVQKGIENTNRIEILSPKFQVSDRIIISGNYSLPDTARVKITQ